MVKVHYARDFCRYIAVFAVHCFGSSFPIISPEKRELVCLLLLFSECNDAVYVLWLFLTV